MIVPSQQTTVGRLVPVEATLDEKLAGLVASNVVAWSRQKLGPVDPPARALGDRMVADLLLEDREWSPIWTPAPWPRPSNPRRFCRQPPQVDPQRR